MRSRATLSRRDLMIRSGQAGLSLASIAACGLSSTLLAIDEGAGVATSVAEIRDAEIRAGVEAAIERNLLPAATEAIYPGHFAITADAQAFGGRTTWPGLDSWQMAGAYLLLGRDRLVRDYFEFVRASQRRDGNIPFAIFPGETQATSYLRGLKSPDDVFTYEPPQREDLPVSSYVAQRWIGLFEHWQTKANPLSTLAPICYILTAAELYAATKSASWLRERLPSIAAAAQWVWSLRGKQGLIGGSGFYIELPPRYGSDGITQCYAIHAFRELASLFAAVGDSANSARWLAAGEQLAASFHACFWRDDHFAEYLHAERGLVDSHGLSDVNWAAVAFGIAVGRRLELVWQRLMAEPGFWIGDMPTQLVTAPFSYETWEYHEPLPWEVSPLKDVAAMGRVWHLEALACQRMQAWDRLVDAARKVCRAGQPDGHWRERYHPQADGTVVAAGAEKYCEYPAVLIRVVWGNRQIFC